jgi:hypothetical protein
MGARFLAGICLMGLLGASEPACPSRARETTSVGTKTAAAAPAPTPAPTEPDLFAATVRPVLAARCAPCHEAGGKMYDRLPFDNSKVVASHRAGVLRRFQGDDRARDRAILEAWLRTQPAN